MFQTIGRAVFIADSMGWRMLWALILGFFVSGIIQAVVSRKEMAKLLPDAAFLTILKATGLGAASSSCSYAATAIARSIVKQGGNFTAAMVFQFASTNLVLELGLILWALLGWQFVLAQFIGGFVMIAFLAVILRLLLNRARVEGAVRQAQAGPRGRMQGHAEMNMSVPTGEPVEKRLFSAKTLTAVSHFFISDVVMLWKDIGLGLLVSGAVAAWVPAGVWSTVFGSQNRVLSAVLGPLVGPIVAMFTFVCSIGNVPLAAVLWNAGSSFGGVISFLFADLIVLPIVDIYRRYYGWRMAAFLLLSFYAAMAASGYIVEFSFALLHLTPSAHISRSAVMAAGFSWDLTTWLNIAFLVLASLLAGRFFATGGPRMLMMMK